MPEFDIGVAVFAVVLLVIWPLSVWWFLRLERRRPPRTATGDGRYRAECVHCEGLGAIPSRSGPSVCAACDCTGLEL